MRPQLVIFAKAPIMGQAKTRLAAGIGPVHAKRIYRAMTSRIIRQVQSDKWETVLAVTPRSWIGRVPDWAGVSQLAQTSGSLTPRLRKIFERKGPTIVIGTDSPQVTKSDIGDAIKGLKSNQAVIGPADDGGFWLLGLNGPGKVGTFENIRWSTEHAMADLAANLTDNVGYLRSLTDIDDRAALLKWRHEARL